MQDESLPTQSPQLSDNRSWCCKPHAPHLCCWSAWPGHPSIETESPTDQNSHTHHECLPEPLAETGDRLRPLRSLYNGGSPDEPGALPNKFSIACLTKLLVSSLSWIVKEEEPADKVNNAGEGGKTTGGLECVGLSVLPESAPIMRGSGGRAFRTGPSAHAGKPTAGGKREEREGDCAKIA